MRTRKEIEKEAENKIRLELLMVELLLDIRDKLK